MFFPRIIDYHTYMRNNLSVPICFEMSNLVDTKMLYKVKDRTFKSLGYKCLSNRLSDYINYVFDIQLNKNLRILGQAWSRQLSQTHIEYLSLNAVSVLDLGLLWTRMKIVKNWAEYKLPRLLPDEDFVKDNYICEVSFRSY
jgi:hypothetical protein